MALKTIIASCQLVRSLFKIAPVTYTGCQQQRNAVKLRRVFPAEVPKIGRKARRLKKRHYVYAWERDTIHEPKPKLQVILTEDVPRIGMKGDLVSVDRSTARNKLLDENLAVYASPENIKEFVAVRKEREDEDVTSLTPTALKTIEYLKKCRLTVRIRQTPEWDVLPKEAVIHAFDKNLGMVVPDHALELPDDPPISRFGTYTVKVAVNKMETVPVEMDVLLYINKARKKQKAKKAAADA